MNKIGIICALDNELEPYLDLIKKNTKIIKAKLEFNLGEIFNKEVVAVSCGAAKVNAAIATQILIDTYGCDFILLSGTAGSVVHELNIGDTFIATSVWYHDVDKSIITNGHPYATNAKFIIDEKFISSAKHITGLFEQKVLFGEMACGEYFINGKERIQLKNCCAIDMESAAVAHTCFVNNIPFGVVKSITDTIEKDTIEDFRKNLVLASQNSFIVATRILDAYIQN